MRVAYGPQVDPKRPEPHDATDLNVDFRSVRLVTPQDRYHPDNRRLEAHE
jgi:hypothetical protein